MALLADVALGRELTDYLSTAIQAGQVNTAKLIWYGALDQFPYRMHNGVFQAWVGLKEANLPLIRLGHRSPICSSICCLKMTPCISTRALLP